MAFFRILTTTACNASCQYCYENGTPVIFMGEDTARQTARFVDDRCHHDFAHLEWFGGEPSLNPEAIGIISDILNECGTVFSSSMVSNGLLLDERITDLLALKWNLRKVQITLDGTSPVHEAIKGLPPGSYDRIMRNIRYLSGIGIAVRLRINYHGDMTETTKLIEDIRLRLSDVHALSAYLSPIYYQTDAYPRSVMLDVLELNKQLFMAHLSQTEKPSITRKRKKRCFMMSPDGYTIAPDGKLYNCSHNMNPEQCVGNIWNYDPDNSVRKTFLSTDLSNECKNCALLSQCLGGCRIAELGLADMVRCHPFKNVYEEVFCSQEQYDAESAR